MSAHSPTQFLNQGKSLQTLKSFLYSRIKSQKVRNSTKETYCTESPLITPALSTGDPSLQSELQPNRLRTTQPSKSQRIALASDEVELKIISSYGVTRSTVSEQPLDAKELHKLDKYLAASMYICLSMLYLKENPLLKEPLTNEHLKARLLGH